MLIYFVFVDIVLSFTYLRISLICFCSLFFKRVGLFELDLFMETHEEWTNL